MSPTDSPSYVTIGQAATTQPRQSHKVGGEALFLLFRSSRELRAEEISQNTMPARDLCGPNRCFLQQRPQRDMIMKVAINRAIEGRELEAVLELCALTHGSNNQCQRRAD